MKPYRCLTLCAAVAAASPLACEQGPDPATVTVGQLAKMLQSESPPVVFDVNGKSTRAEYGVIPNATLLPNSSGYPLDLLPDDRDKPLVFYCASTWCGAAEGAARRAMKAGYASVSVLPEGIKGWASAGLATASGAE